MRDALEVPFPSRARSNAPPPRPAAGRASRRSGASARRSAAAPAVALVLGVIVGAMALLGLREKIVRLVPQAAAAYAAIGVPVNLVGLDLRDVHARLAPEGMRKVLSVEGEIVNPRRVAVRVPPLLLSVRGANGRDAYAWSLRPERTRLEPGEKLAFRARLVSPPADGADVFVRFAEAGRRGG